MVCLYYTGIYTRARPGAPPGSAPASPLPSPVRDFGEFDTFIRLICRCTQTYIYN